MSEKDCEGFLGRWSRRKLAPAAAGNDEPQSADAKATNAAAREEAFADVDFASLDFTSDYQRFMANAVPDRVRNRALRQLWSSSALIAEPDELDEFREDFRDVAKAVPAAMARSAYRIGRGLVDGDPEITAPEDDFDKAIRGEATDTSGEHAGSGEDLTSVRPKADQDTTKRNAARNAAPDSSNRRQSTDG